MRILISPAKKMRPDADGPVHTALPQFLSMAQTIMAHLQSMSAGELQALWQCNDAIAAFNIERLRRMNLQKNLTPALLAYEGIQYQYMAPRVFETKQLDYVDRHLRILSGFYGLLRPFDGVTSYRLEMQARLGIDGCRDLYDYWGGSLAAQLSSETGLILNLASQEYSRAVTAHLPSQIRVLTCIFGERKGDKVVEKGTLCKMARGQMVRWLAERNITDHRDVRAFDQLGYVYSKEHSDHDHYTFLKGGA